MGMIKTLPLAILFSLASSFVAADNEQLYIGVGAYEANIDGDFDGLDDDDTTAAAFLGYKFSKMFAIEAGYYDLGDYSGRNVDVEVDAFSLAGALILPLAIFDIYAKAGIAYINVDVDAGARSDDDSDSEAFAGVGANINLGRHIDLYAEYLYFDTDIDVDTLGLGVRFLF